MPNNLYQHPRKEPNRWRYRQQDESWYYFDAPTTDAIAAAEQLNQDRQNHEKPKQPKPGRLSFTRHVDEFIKERENRDPSLQQKQSWRDRRGYLRKLAKDMQHTTINRVTLMDLQKYWDSFSGNAQRSRRAEFKRFFNHLITRELCPTLICNPFTTDDSKAQVAMRAKPAKARLRLSTEQFWQIYNKAGEMGLTFLQTAMGISLTTTMRRSDICDLRFDDHVIGAHLRKQINKSHAQLSQAEFKADPSNLSWNLEKQPILRKLINQAKESSLMHARCPHIIHFKPERRIKGDNRQHSHQVLPDYLTRAFADARDACGCFANLPTKARPSFHEIRSLSSHLYKKTYGNDRIKEVQVLMAHTDEKITKHYQQGHETHWTEIDLTLPEAVLQGEF